MYEIKLADIFRDLASKKKLTAFSLPTTFMLLIIAYVIANAKKIFVIHLGTIPSMYLLIRFCRNHITMYFSLGFVYLDTIM